MQCAAFYLKCIFDNYEKNKQQTNLPLGMRPPSVGLDPRLRSPADQMAAALRAAGPLGPPPGTSQAFGLPPGLSVPTSLAYSVAGMDAMLANR